MPSRLGRGVGRGRHMPARGVVAALTGVAILPLLWAPFASGFVGNPAARGVLGGRGGAFRERARRGEHTSVAQRGPSCARARARECTRAQAIALACVGGAARAWACPGRAARCCRALNGGLLHRRIPSGLRACASGTSRHRGGRRCAEGCPPGGSHCARAHATPRRAHADAARAPRRSRARASSLACRLTRQFLRPTANAGRLQGEADKWREPCRGGRGRGGRQRRAP